MLALDGSAGGGQLLRTALTLSLCLQRPFRMIHIRAQRRHPGLARQHLTAVAAAAHVGNAEVHGATLGAQTLTFIPHGLRGGDYRFDIGSAGSTTLVLQTLLPALLQADRPSRLTLIGGTHNPLAPVYEFLSEVYLPVLWRMGADAKLTLERAGYYPRGGGILHAQVCPSPLRPVEILSRGALLDIRGECRVSGLPRHIAEREARVLCEELKLAGEKIEIVAQPPSWGPGNCCLVRVSLEKIDELFSAIGRRGIPAEQVAGEVVNATRAYLEGEAAVDSHLADQLMVPFALAGGGACRIPSPSDHVITNRAVIEAFLPSGRFLLRPSLSTWELRWMNISRGGTDVP